jgi:hypothetical protein
MSGRREVLQHRAAPIQVDLVTYPELIAYFVSDRPAEPRVRRGAILRQRSRSGYLIRQMFLDQQDQVVCDPSGEPYGRTIEARDLDEELLETFGDQDLILVQ